MSDNGNSTHNKYLCPPYDCNISTVCEYNHTKMCDHVDKYIEYDILNFHVLMIKTNNKFIIDKDR